MNRQSPFLYLILILFSLIIIIPIYTTVIGGFKSIGELRVNILGLPNSWVFDNYVGIVLNSKFWTYISNSILYAGLTVFFTILLSSMSAFVFAHIHFIGNRFLFNYLLLGLLFPFATAILPLFLRVRDLELLGTV
ncbi:MAG: carbohydrate ABC transporter permease, partial [Deltaproteobacteria bacterium]